MKPILFNTEMVQAILDGRKTVTRRVIKFPEKQTGQLPPNGDKDYLLYPCGIKRSPYQPGDILYVREMFSRLQCVDCMSNSEPFIHCGIKPDDKDGCFVYKTSDCLEEIRWSPSIHMPKKAARLFLRVTDVRVERLQDITNEQAEKEGCNDYTSTANGFFDVWDKTMKPKDRPFYGWDANPLVWVIEFERISKEEAYSG